MHMCVNGGRTEGAGGVGEVGRRPLSPLRTNALVDKCVAKDSSRNMRAVSSGGRGRRGVGRENITLPHDLMTSPFFVLARKICNT